MPFRRTKRMVNQINATAQEAQVQLSARGEELGVALRVAAAMVEDIMDGVTIKVINDSEHSLIDFFTGKCKELPIKVVIDPSDDVEDEGQ